MTKSILSQLSIIMTSSFDIVSPKRIRGGIKQVSGWTTAGPRRIRGGIRVSRGGIESGQVRGSAGGLEKLSAGVSGLVKKTLDCTVLLTRFEFGNWMDQGLVDGGQTKERTFFGVIHAVYI